MRNRQTSLSGAVTKGQPCVSFTPACVPSAAGEHHAAGGHHTVRWHAALPAWCPPITHYWHGHSTQPGQFGGNGWSDCKEGKWKDVLLHLLWNKSSVVLSNTCSVFFGFREMAGIDTEDTCRWRKDLGFCLEVALLEWPAVADHSRVQMFHYLSFVWNAWDQQEQTGSFQTCYCSRYGSSGCAMMLCYRESRWGLLPHAFHSVQCCFTWRHTKWAVSGMQSKAFQFAGFNGDDYLCQLWHGTSTAAWWPGRCLSVGFGWLTPRYSRGAFGSGVSSQFPEHNSLSPFSYSTNRKLFSIAPVLSHPPYHSNRVTSNKLRLLTSLLSREWLIPSV